MFNSEINFITVLSICFSNTIIFNLNPYRWNVEYISKNEYEGWGTALKPANEPICLARKPLSEGTVAENVLKWGTGGINIDGCRVEGDEKLLKHIEKYGSNSDYGNDTSTIFGQIKSNVICGSTEGRFPANIILDEIAGELLDEQSGQSKSSGHKIEKRNNNSLWAFYNYVTLALQQSHPKTWMEDQRIFLIQHHCQLAMFR